MTDDSWDIIDSNEMYGESDEDDLDLYAERVITEDEKNGGFFSYRKISVDNTGKEDIQYNQAGVAAPRSGKTGVLPKPDKANLTSRPTSPSSELSPSVAGLFPVENVENVEKIQPLDAQFTYKEVIVDKNGSPRQAGSDTQEGQFIRRFKQRAEENLYVYSKGVLGRTFLTAHFHQDVCNFLQITPPFRKLVLMPREHAKTTIVAGSLPSHILIQPPENNIYFPGLSGRECRILLAGETEKMAKKNLRVIKSVFEENAVFRAFWPHCCWPKGQRPKEWSTEQIIIPRSNEWPDPTVRAVGVGGAITGARPNVMLKDDLISFKARNSPVVMQEAIDWHVASRALLDTYEVESGLQSLEFIIGTRWAVFDLYSYIIDNDPSVEVISDAYHRIIRDGKILWPEKHTEESIEQLRLEHGSNFYLLYLNSAADPSLTDFDTELLRVFSIKDDKFVFEGDSRDLWLTKRMETVFGKDMGQVSAALEQLPQRGEKFNLGRVAEIMRGSGIRLIGGR